MITDNNYTTLLLLNLKKAFDTVNHKILMNKLENYGVHSVALNLFFSFLSNRFQYVSLENHAAIIITKYQIWSKTQIILTTVSFSAQDYLEMTFV